MYMRKGEDYILNYGLYDNCIYEQTFMYRYITQVRYLESVGCGQTSINSKTHATNGLSYSYNYGRLLSMYIVH